VQARARTNHVRIASITKTFTATTLLLVDRDTLRTRRSPPPSTPTRWPRSRSSARRELDGEFRRALARLDVEPVDDRLRELAKLAGQVLAWRDELAARVNALTSLRYTAGESRTEQLRAEVALFERALDRCAALLGLMARLGIDTRLARISERQADAVVRAADAAIAAAGVTGPTRCRPGRPRPASCAW
jgi:hypothetical protein